MSHYKPEKRDRGYKATQWLPIVISVVSLLVSLGSIYYQYYWEHHDFRAIITRGDDERGVESEDVLLENYGNRPELVYMASVAFGPQLGERGPSMTPTIIPAQQVLLVHLPGVRIPRTVEDRDVFEGNRLRVGASFWIIDGRSANRNDSKLYIDTSIGFTRLTIGSNGKTVGAAPGADDHQGFVNLYDGVKEE